MKHFIRDVRSAVTLTIGVLLSLLAGIEVAAREAQRPHSTIAASATARIDAARNATWDDRPFLLGQLGLVKDASVVDFLVQELASPNWREVLEAAEVLRELATIAPTARTALSKVAQQHWMPCVRETAEAAVTAINTGHSDPQSPPRCYSITYKCVRHAGDRGPGWSTYHSLTSPPPPEVNRGNLYGFISYPVEDGVFWGTNRSEWGGELQWRAGRKVEQIASGRMFGIVQRPWGLLLLQSTIHHRSGRISELRRDKNGGWRAEPRLELPGPPVAILPDPTGRLSIECGDDGVLTLSAKGEVERYECL